MERDPSLESVQAMLAAGDDSAAFLSALKEYHRIVRADALMSIALAGREILAKSTSVGDLIFVRYRDEPALLDEHRKLMQATLASIITELSQSASSSDPS